MIQRYTPPTLEDYDWDPRTETAALTYLLEPRQLKAQPLSKHVSADYETLKVKYYTDLAIWINAEHRRNDLVGRKAA